MKKKILLTIISVIFCGLAAGCFISKIGDNLGSITEGMLNMIQGTLGEGFSTAANPLPLTRPVDQVWAVPLRAG